MKNIKNKIKNYLTTNTKKNIHDIYALEKLSPLNINYSVWTSSAIRPSAIVKILNEIIVNNKKIIIEFGSGLSTIYIAKTLKKMGGKLYSIENDENWIEIVKKMLKDDGLEDCVHFIHAPLKPSSLSLNNLDWYDENLLNNLKRDEKIDLVLVDGPMAFSKDIELSRYPAIPLLHNNNHLGEDTTIILDDINRNGEEKILRLWEKKFNIKFSRLYADGGIAIKINKKAFNI
jgi:predicted O-methyltransferase YrrM